MLENELVRYTFDAAGALTGGYDKEEQRQVLAKPVELQLFEDAPVNWEAWDVDVFYPKQLRETLKPASCEAFGGPLRQGLSLVYRFGKSTLKQQVVLARGSKRLDFVTEADWHERRRMLRAAFFTGLVNGTARFDIQFGTLERPAHNNTSWDGARFEVAAHRFADLSFGGWGVAVLNDCKYGYKVLNGEISLNLLRSPVHPDPDADQGSHRFTYSLLPHKDDLRDSRVFAEAVNLNQPPLVFAGRSSKETALMLPAHVEGDGVVFEAMKKAERGEAWVLRVWECRGCRAEATLTVAGKARCHETDLMERDQQEVKLEGGSARIVLRPFDVRTFKVTTVK